MYNYCNLYIIEVLFFLNGYLYISGEASIVYIRSIETCAQVSDDYASGVKVNQTPILVILPFLKVKDS